MNDFFVLFKEEPIHHFALTLKDKSAVVMTLARKQT